MPRRELARKRQIVGLGLLGLLVVAGLAWGATYTALFGADEIRIEGADRVETSEIGAIAGLARGVNVFHLDATAAEAALEADARIADATVTRELPDVVVVTIRERLPVAATLVDGTPTVVAEDGTFLPGPTPRALPEIQVAAGELDEDDLASTARALAALPPSLRRLVDVAIVGLAGDLSFTLREGPSVRYGLPVDVASKSQSLEAVLDWAAAKRIDLTTIDITVPGAPSARTAGGTVTPG